MKVSGSFDVEITPLASELQTQDGISLGSMSLSKSFEGALRGKSVGQMLTARTTVPSSAGYVAVEQFVGELDGKTGSFVLQHYGIMSTRQKRLVLEVVPDSGAGAHASISGSMTIDNDGGEHHYAFEYELG